MSYSGAMSAAASPDPSTFDATIEIDAPPDAVHAAFFDAGSLRAWWGTCGSVTTATPLGVFAVEWPVSADADPLIGPFGGAFYGMVIDVRPGREFFLADAYWVPPAGDPIGPMALDVTCEPIGTGTRLRVHQSGCDDSPRWQRYYRVMGARWLAALKALKAHLEGAPTHDTPDA